jgi:hypothetical protein
VLFRSREGGWDALERRRALRDAATEGAPPAIEEGRDGGVRSAGAFAHSGDRGSLPLAEQRFGGTYDFDLGEARASGASSVGLFGACWRRAQGIAHFQLRIDIIYYVTYPQQP